MSRKMIETTTIWLPAHWQDGIIHGVFTYMDDQAEIIRLEYVMARLADDDWKVTAVSERGRWTWSYEDFDAGSECEGGEIAEYTLSRIRRS